MLERLLETLKSDAVQKDEMMKKIFDTIEYLFKNMTNLFHDLSNNKRLIRYSPTAMNMFIAMYTSSSGAYSEYKSSHVFPTPSYNTIRNAIGKTSDVETNDTFLYDRLDEGAIIHLLCDEIKVRQGITYNSQSNKILGFVKCDDLKRLVKRILTNKEEENLTTHYNQWSARTSTNKYIPLSFFSNDGSLDANESLRQFLYVNLRCCSRNVIVIGFLVDAASCITGMLTLLRRKDTLPKYVLTLPKEMCSFSHPFHDKVRIATILCSGHGMKRTRGQLFASSSTGSRNLCIDGTFFGWRTVLEIAIFDQGKPFPKTGLDNIATEPIGRKAMNMRGMKYFEHCISLYLFIYKFDTF